MRNTLWLVGDYANTTKRQQQAAKAGCAVTIDFHFNSNGSTATGGEVWFKPNDDASENLAAAILQGYSTVGLPVRGTNSADPGTRAAFIRHYQSPAVLTEPLFVSNKTQAQWIHNPDNVSALARVIAAALEDATKPGDLIGLSIGHRCKTSEPNDTGAACILGDTEATHGIALALAVAALLAGGTVEPPACAKIG
ncbi:MAG TPA: N-acetylmuramoyl-L-alanine amidase [Chthoniobacter sp.]|jgi:hypothetical protein